MSLVCDGNLCVVVKGKDLPKKGIIMPSNDIEWLVYGKDWCTYCIKAKELLKDNHIYINIEEYQITEELSILTNNHPTVPMIFHYTTFIGGYDNLSHMLLNQIGN